MRIGLLGGTFDPVHYGHLAMAETAGRLFGLESVYFVTAVDPPHKSHRAQANFLDRHAMVALALSRHLKLVPCSQEFGWPGKSYSIDTVKEFRHTLGEAVPIFFLIGADAFLEFPTWKEYQRFTDYCSFVVFARPGSTSSSNLQVRLPQTVTDNIVRVPRGKELPLHSANRVYWLDYFRKDISSTAIRRRIQEGRSISRLVPASVEEFIRKTRLYLT